MTCSLFFPATRLSQMRTLMCSKPSLALALLLLIGTSGVGEGPQSTSQEQPSRESANHYSSQQMRFKVGPLRFQNGGQVKFLGFTPDGSVLITQSELGLGSMIRYWDMRTGTEIKGLPVLETWPAFESVISPNG